MHRSTTTRRRIVTALVMTLSVLSLILTLFVIIPTPHISALAPTTVARATERPAADAFNVEDPGFRRDVRPAVSASEPAAPSVAPAVATIEPAAQQPPPSQLVALPALTVDVWNAAERYFAISGDSPESILASGEANSPSDPSGAERNAMAYAGPTQWQHQPTYVVDAATGDCTMTGVTSAVAYQATLPQWTSPSNVSPELLAWWRVVLDHIRVHEGHHIHIFTDFVNALPGRVTGQPCSSWESIVNQWSAEIVSAQAAFDASEAEWVSPRYTGP